MYGSYRKMGDIPASYGIVYVRPGKYSDLFSNHPPCDLGSRHSTFHGDLTRPKIPPNGGLVREMVPPISGKSRLVKFYEFLARSFKGLRVVSELYSPLVRIPQIF